MANIQRNNVVQRAIDAFGLQAGVDVLPNKSADGITPVLDVTQAPINIVREGVRTTSGTASAYTTPTDRDFYLKYIDYNCQSDATCDNTYFYVGVTINGRASYLVYRYKITTTATMIQGSCYFGEKGIKLDRGTSITAVTAYSAGNSAFGVCAGGYLE